MKHNRLKQFFQDFYLALILLFLYIPIVTMIVSVSYTHLNPIQPRRHAAQQHIRRRKCRHRLNHDNRSRHNDRIMASLDADADLLAALIDGSLLLSLIHI